MPDLKLTVSRFAAPEELASRSRVPFNRHNQSLAPGAFVASLFGIPRKYARIKQ